MIKYSIGIDFGTLSARGALINLTDGSEAASSEFIYPHAILDNPFFDGITLPKAATLQHPQDYIDALSYVVRELLSKSSVKSEDVVGIGIDFTSSTVLPVDKNGTPLCFLDEFKNNPHAYVKLWKHHGAEEEAQKITALAQKRNEKWLSIYGGKVSSEWLFPKLLEILNKAPEVYDRTDRFVEAADWLVWKITGIESRSSCMAGYKALWNKKDGYPTNEFFELLHPEMKNVIGTKITENIVPTGTKCGEINEYGSALTGLNKGTAVAAAIIDAHAALPAGGITDEGKLMMIVGTSSCHIVMSKEEKKTEGICGYVEDGIIPGFVAYEAGQSCVGDSFDWFMRNCVPDSYCKEAEKNGENIFELISRKAHLLSPGADGLLAIDWWNGNRTPYADYELSGAILGLTLKTKPEEIFRAIVESTAYGVKRIIKLYKDSGININEIYAAGGISQKNSFLMQLYSDVLGEEIKVVDSPQAGAKGSAIFAATAGGYFDTVKEAAQVIADGVSKVYSPDVNNTAKYEILYEEYEKLSEYFAKTNDVMKKLKSSGNS